MISSLLKSVVKIFSSNKFFTFIVVLLVLQASWIAVSGKYPQAFDEQYHFGVAELHAQKWSPFFAVQPEGADQYGALVRDPQILYHYSLSLVYRFVALFTDSQITQVILLRFTSIALAVWALFLFRRLLRLFNISNAKANLAILFVTLLPVYPLLAGQLNYDNLLIPAATLSIIWTIQLYQSYNRKKQLDWAALFRLLIALTLFSTIKFAFNPITFAIVLLLIPLVWKSRKTIRSGIASSVAAMNTRVRVAYVVAALIAGWLFVGSIGLNIVRYQEADPPCHKVISVEQCLQFGPYARDYASKQDDHYASIERMAGYPFKWTRNMLRESVFSVYSYFDGNGVVHYYGGDKVPQMMIMAWAWLVIMLVAILFSVRFLWRSPATRILLVVSVIYTGAVFFVNARLFYRVDYVAAVHGRYLFPVIIPLIICAILGADHLRSKLSKLHRVAFRNAAISLVLASLVVFTQGGGMITYILYSGNGSFWSSDQVPVVRSANSVLRGVFQKTTLFD